MIKKLFHSARSSQALRQSALVTVGTTVTALIMAVAMILASRVLGPEKFGIFSVGVSLSGIFIVGTNLGLNQLIPRLVNRWHDQPQKLQDFVGYIIFIKIGCSIVLIILASLCIPLLTQLLNFPHPEIIFWTILGSVGLGWYEHVYLMLSARHNFMGVNILSISQSLIKAIGFFGVLLVLNLGLPAVFLVYFLTPALIALFWGWLWQKQVFAKPHQGNPAMNTIIAQFFGHTFIGIIAMVLTSNVDVLFVQRALSSFDTGIYAGASRIALFIGFVTASVGGVLNNRVARYRDKETLKKYLLKSLSIVAIAMLGFLCFLPFAQLAIFYTIGPEYLSGTLALIILIFNAFLSLAVVPYTAFFYAIDHPAYFSLGGIVQISIIIIGNLLFLDTYGLEAAAWSRVVATLVYSGFTAGYIWYAWQKIKT